MARKRDITPEFFTDEKIGSVPYGARLLFPAIWCHADLRGVFEYNPKQLRVLAFPYDEGLLSGTVLEWLQALESQGMVARFEADGKAWGHVTKWAKHQSISAREVEIGSARPTPPGWVDPPEWRKVVENGIKAGRCKRERFPELFRERFPGPTQNNTPSPSPSPAPSISPAAAAAGVPPPRVEVGEKPQPPPSDPVFDGEAPPRRIQVAQDWFTWRQKHERLYFGRSDEDGNLASWQSLFNRAGVEVMDAMYAALLPTIPPKHRIGYSAALAWIATNAVDD